MQVEQPRNSFDISYPNNHHLQLQTDTNNSPLASFLEDAQRGDAADVRLSADKQKMLETFKTTIREQAIDFHEQLKQSSIHIQEPSEAHSIPSQIPEDSNESEDKTVRQSLAAKAPNQEQTRESPRFNRTSSLSANQYTAFPQRALLLSCDSLESHRQQLVDSINLAIDFLCRGVLLRKYCFNRFKVETVALTFSEDFEFVGVYVLEKRQMSVLPMGEFVALQKGLKSWRFGEYVRQGYHIDQSLAFSLTFRQRSFDLLADSEEMRERIVRHFQVLHESA